jgi:DNA-binding transcriptional LysR family regulator
MNDLDITTLRLFIDVCDLKSIKNVSEIRQINSPSITKRLAKLEEQLQTKLFKRVRRGIEPTPEGALLSEQFRRVVNDVQKITDSMAQRRAGISGMITIASHMNSMASFLCSDLASFVQVHAHQTIKMNIREMISKDVVQAVRDGIATMGVVWDNTETSGLQHAPYYNDTLMAMMRRNHPLANRTSISFAEAAGFDLVADKHTRHTEALLRRSGGITTDDSRISMQVDTPDTAIRMAAAGVGIYICQLSVGQLRAKELDLAMVRLTDPWANVRVKIVFKSNLISPLAKVLIDHLTHQHQEINPT